MKPAPLTPAALLRPRSFIPRRVEARRPRPYGRRIVNAAIMGVLGELLVDYWAFGIAMYLGGAVLAALLCVGADYVSAKVQIWKGRS